MLIGVGLAVCYLANVWNIGAEGQLTVGRDRRARSCRCCFPAWQIAADAAAACWSWASSAACSTAPIPALLKTRFGANEILTSLMLVYVAQLFLDWLVRGPWRDPQGFNFPTAVTFDGWQLLPTIGGDRSISARSSRSVAALALAS